MEFRGYADAGIMQLEPQPLGVGPGKSLGNQDQYTAPSGKPDGVAAEMGQYPFQEMGGLRGEIQIADGSREPPDPDRSPAPVAPVRIRFEPKRTQARRFELSPASARPRFSRNRGIHRRDEARTDPLRGYAGAWRADQPSTLRGPESEPIPARRSGDCAVHGACRQERRFQGNYPRAVRDACMSGHHAQTG